MNYDICICPQCGAPLPRQARWRSVICTYCQTEVTLSEHIVPAARFKEAYQRSRAGAMENTIACNGERYKVLLPLGQGETARIMLAQRLGALHEHVIIKLGLSQATPGRLRQEAEVLQQLQALNHTGSAYFSQRLPQPVGYGPVEDTGGVIGEALLLRSPSGYWGSLADVHRYYPDGIEPCHAIWIWRRILETLDYIHEAGWSHGRLSSDHLLVQPADHGILLIGWAEAGRNKSIAQSIARDLVQSAWTIRSLLHGGGDEPPIKASTPEPLAVLLKRASEDGDWCASVGASGIDQALQTAAHAIFGAPRFIHFSPNNQR